MQPMHADRPHDPLTPNATEAETLVGRLLDREATMEERRRFEGLASTDPALWRALAERQLDMDLLAQGIEEHIGAADRIEVSLAAPRRLAGWATTFSGWAAALLLGITWTVLSARAPERSAMITDAPLLEKDLSPQEHLKEYLRAEHVVGVLAPILLETEQLPDGRYRMRIIRRIEEYQYPEPLP